MFVYGDSGYNRLGEKADDRRDRERGEGRERPYTRAQANSAPGTAISRCVRASSGSQVDHSLHCREHERERERERSINRLIFCSAFNSGVCVSFQSRPAVVAVR